MRPARRERGDRGVWSPESAIRMVQDSEAPVESSSLPAPSNAFMKQRVAQSGRFRRAAISVGEQLHRSRLSLAQRQFQYLLPDERRQQARTGDKLAEGQI